MTEYNVAVWQFTLTTRGLIWGRFTPTPKHSNTQELNKDILEFTRKVRLVEYFDGVEEEDKSLVRNKSDFVPPHGREELLDAFVKHTNSVPLVPTEKSKIRRNVTWQEQTSISELASDESIIIKQADKGGATVIMDKQFYQEHIDKMLQNNEYYKQLEENPHKEIMKKI